MLNDLERQDGLGNGDVETRHMAGTIDPLHEEERALLDAVKAKIQNGGITLSDAAAFGKVFLDRK